MKRLTLNTLLATAAATTCLLAVTDQQANAFGIGWNYTKDSFTDSTAYDLVTRQSQVGGTSFEIYGLAFRQDGDKITVALNANLDIRGWNDSQNGNIAKQVGGVNNGLRNIGYGDLIFNFSGKAKFSDAKSSELFGIHFGQGNDSGVTTAGLYKDITVESVTTKNSGWGSFTSYNDYVKNHGGVAGLGDVAANSSYFDQSTGAPNSIKSGTLVTNSNFQMLNASALGALGLNFNQGLGSNSLGSQTFGFSFNKTKDMTGNFMASLFAECGNDGIVAKGEMVPEPTTMLGTALAGFGFISARLRRRRQAA